MLVNIIGPNLRDQSKGSYHVHAAECADIARRYRDEDGATPEEAIECASRCDAAAHIYDNGIMEENGDGPEAYLFDFHFAPCCASLPVETPGPENFSLDIDLGNAAMKDGEDVAEVLRKVANELEAGKTDEGIIFDLNGNRVGGFAFDQLRDKRPDA